jgi:hypothetical protein
MPDATPLLSLAAALALIVIDGPFVTADFAIARAPCAPRRARRAGLDAAFGIDTMKFAWPWPRAATSDVVFERTRRSRSGRRGRCPTSCAWDGPCRRPTCAAATGAGRGDAPERRRRRGRRPRPGTTPNVRPCPSPPSPRAPSPRSRHSSTSPATLRAAWRPGRPQPPRRARADDGSHFWPDVGRAALGLPGAAVARPGPAAHPREGADARRVAARVGGPHDPLGPAPLPRVVGRATCTRRATSCLRPAS